MTKALISIDYSYDFVADDGKLTAGKPAQAIEDRIAQVTQEAYDNGDYIFVAMDRHDEGDTFHPETKLFPPHNIAGTAGRELYGKLAGVYDAIKDDQITHTLIFVMAGIIGRHCLDGDVVNRLDAINTIAQDRFWSDYHTALILL